MLNPEYPTKLQDDAYGGQCLISTGFIPAGAIVWERNPDVDMLKTLKAIENLSPAAAVFWDTYGYAVFYENGNFKGIEINLDNAKFMNHSEDPNVYEENSVVIRAARDIQPGEPITCHYGDFWAPELHTWAEYQAENPYVLTKVTRTWRKSAMEPTAKAA